MSFLFVFIFKSYYSLGKEELVPVHRDFNLFPCYLCPQSKHLILQCIPHKKRNCFLKLSFNYLEDFSISFTLLHRLRCERGCGGSSKFLYKREVSFLFCSHYLCLHLIVLQYFRRMMRPRNLRMKKERKWFVVLPSEIMKAKETPPTLVVLAKPKRMPGVKNSCSIRVFVLKISQTCCTYHLGYLKHLNP